MEKKIFKPLEKVADINIKDEFLSGKSLDSKILDIAFKSIPLLKDQQYKLDIKYKNNENGFANGVISIKIPEKNNPGGLVSVTVPILIDSYKLKPLDTFIINDVSYPTTDSTMRELLNDPDNFRKLTQKEIRESKILSKIAEDHYDDIMNTLKKTAEESTDENIKYLSTVYYKSLEHFSRMQKQADEHSEPITDYIIQKRRDLNFDLYYIKTASKNEGLQFYHEVSSPESIRLLLEATGYNSIKLADEINSGKELYLQSPVYDPKADIVRSMKFDPSSIKKNSMFSDVKKGPTEIADSKGKLLQGFVYDMYEFSGMANAFPTQRIFIDLKKNYVLSPSFSGKPTEGDFILKEDNMAPGDTGVFLDPTEDNAYGLIKILNLSRIEGEGETAEVQIANKKYKIRKEKLLKRYVITGNEILIPDSYKWVSLQKKITLLEQNMEDKINQKIAETSYTIYKKASDDIKIVKFMGDKLNRTDRPIVVPKDQHLKLLVNKLNFLTTDKDTILDEINHGIPLTFSTNYPMQNIGMMPVAPVVQKTTERYEPSIRLKTVDIIKKASAPITDVFVEVFNSKKANPEFYTKEMDGLLKEGATTDTLDTIFSLGIVSDVNSTIFLENIDKLKFVLSYLTTLRLYIRYGWQIGLKEADLNVAIESLSDIIQKLQLVKTQKILDKQLNMQIY